MDESTRPAAGLYVIAGPIGNPADISERAKRTLSEVDCVYAEDTRRAARLFRDLGIRAKRLDSLHEHTEGGKVRGVLERISGGKSVGILSDAGTPLIADPGYLLVKGCREAGAPVFVLPGPSAVLTALVGSGFPPIPFVFLGFLPRTGGGRKKTLAPFAGTGATLIFFERKDRVWATLAAALEVLGDRPCCIAREMTKTHEEFRFGTLAAPPLTDEDLLGEITLVIGPPGDGPAPVLESLDLDAVIAEERDKGGAPKEIAKRVAARVPNVNAKAVYARIAGNRD